MLILPSSTSPPIHILLWILLQEKWKVVLIGIYTSQHMDMHNSKDTTYTETAMHLFSAQHKFKAKLLLTQSTQLNTHWDAIEMSLDALKKIFLHFVFVLRKSAKCKNLFVNFNHVFLLLATVLTRNGHCAVYTQFMMKATFCWWLTWNFKLQ